jgi:methyl-accepting chemotaxis protein
MTAFDYKMMSRRLGRLKLWQKLGWLVFALAIPTTLVGFFYVSWMSKEVSQARDEVDGARYLAALDSVQSEILTHRGRAFVLLSGDAARAADVVAQEAEVDKQIAALDRLDSRIGHEAPIAAQWQSVKSEWDALKSKAAKQSPEDSEAAHTSLLNHLDQLAERVGLDAKTSIDPNQNTRMLIRVAAELAPQAARYNSNLRNHSVRAAAKGYLGGDDRTGVQIFHDHFQSNLDAIRARLEQLPPDLRSSVQPAFDAASLAGTEFYGIVQSKLLNASNLQVTAAELYDAGVPTNRALKKLSAAGYAAVDLAVRDRLSKVTWKRNLSIGVALLALAVALALSRLVTLSLANPLRQAIAVFEKIAAGKYDNEIHASGADEASQVLVALERMQGQLRAQLQKERTAAAENSRIRQALDKASTSVVLADPSHRIVYLNEAAQASFARNAFEIRKTLRDFDATQLRGSSLESLSPDVSNQRRLLDNLTGTEVQEPVLGEFTFRTVTSPVLDDKGQRLGTVMEWTQRTQEVRIEKELQTMLSAVNSGKLRARIDLGNKTGFFESMSRGVNQLADKLSEMVGRVKNGAGEIQRGAEEISAGNANLSLRTQEQASSLEETASSMEQMTTTVKQNADNAGQANQLAVAARDQAEAGGTVVRQAVNAMADINDSAKKIADIIGVIDEIAFQTNLLALNAAVEAARAGEQGRGFAVVASEVRSLAGRSATAAKEIKELIQDSVKKVEDGSTLVTQSGQTLEQIVTSVKKVSDIVAEIAAASREQSSGIEQVNRAVMQMDDLTQQNAALVEQATAASKTMADQAKGLGDILDRYELDEMTQAPAPVAREASTAPRIERRGPNRPWSKKTAARTQPASQASGSRPEPAAASAPRPALAATSGQDSSEWQEF